MDYFYFNEYGEFCSSNPASSDPLPDGVSPPSNAIMTPPPECPADKWPVLNESKDAWILIDKSQLVGVGKATRDIYPSLQIGDLDNCFISFDLFSYENIQSTSRIMLFFKSLNNSNQISYLGYWISEGLRHLNLFCSILTRISRTTADSSTLS